MKSVVRAVLVWVLLLATCWQGVASATMLDCDVIASMSVATAGCDHHAMHPAAARSVPLHHRDSGHAAAQSHCAQCAACCVGFALQPAPPMPPAAEAHSFGPIPFLLARLPGFVPETPQRPPQRFLA